MKKLVIVAGTIVAAIVAFYAVQLFFGGGDELTGSWVLVKSNVKEFAQIPLVLTFRKGGETRWAIGDQMVAGEYRTDPEASPKMIDLPNPLVPQIGAGIYEIKDDTLQIVLGQRRPTKMAGGPNVLVLEFKRR